jgi:hypothetical protein
MIRASIYENYLRWELACSTILILTQRKFNDVNGGVSDAKEFI